MTTTTTHTTSLDLDRLEKVRHLPGKVTARCPACAEEGRDKRGLHLVVFPDGAFSCIADSGHGPRIRDLVGIREALDPEERRNRNREDAARRHRERERVRKVEQAKSALPTLIEKWSWLPEDVHEDSPTRIDDTADDPRLFLAALFPHESTVWTGTVYQSGKLKYRDRWRTIEEILWEPRESIGPMTTPATWKGGTCHRKREQIAEAKFIVLDFDSIPTTGKAPATSQERHHLQLEALAVVRWLREDRRWNLAAIVSTGSKSLHVWFRYPGEESLAGLRESMTALGIDPSLIGHPEHPCRLPGQVHEKTGGTSRTLWLQ